MTVGVIFRFAGEIVEVRIKGANVFFRTSSSPQLADISGIKFDRAGVFKEFPDLKDKEDWKQQAEQRFKEKIRNMETEKERIQYVINDLMKYGYKPEYIAREGFRPVKIKL